MYTRASCSLSFFFKFIHIPYKTPKWIFIYLLNYLVLVTVNLESGAFISCVIWVSFIILSQSQSLEIQSVCIHSGLHPTILIFIMKYSFWDPSISAYVQSCCIKIIPIILLHFFSNKSKPYQTLTISYWKKKVVSSIFCLN